MLRQSALGVVLCVSAGSGQAVLAAVMPEAEQQGTHCLIRLSGSRGTAVCLQGFRGFLEGQQDSDMSHRVE